MRPAALRARGRSSPWCRAGSSRRTRRRVPTRRADELLALGRGDVERDADASRGPLEERHRQRAVDVVACAHRRPGRRAAACAGSVDAPAARPRSLRRPSTRGRTCRAGPATNRLTSITRDAGQRRARIARRFGVAHAVGASSRSRWRSTNFWILPLGVRGNSSTARTSSGHFCRASPRCSRCVAHRGEVRRGRCRAACGRTRSRVLAEPGVGRGDDRDLGDARHAHEQLLDLGRADVLAAADDDVLLAVGDREVAVGVEHADVAGHEPAVGVNAAAVRCRVGVADEAVGPATPDLARLARRDVVAVLVDEAHLDARQRCAVGVQPLLARRLGGSSR